MLLKCLERKCFALVTANHTTREGERRQSFFLLGSSWNELIPWIVGNDSNQDLFLATAAPPHSVSPALLLFLWCRALARQPHAALASLESQGQLLTSLPVPRSTLGSRAGAVPGLGQPRAAGQGVQAGSLCRVSLCPCASTSHLLSHLSPQPRDSPFKVFAGCAAQLSSCRKSEPFPDTMGEKAWIHLGSTGL